MGGCTDRCTCTDKPDLNIFSESATSEQEIILLCYLYPSLTINDYQSTLIHNLITKIQLHKIISLRFLTDAVT